MKTKQIIEAAHRLSKPYRVRNEEKFRLKDVDPGDTGREIGHVRYQTLPARRSVYN
ncbi:MAG TPA: hypothetical protein VK850_05395 [Candidatus Binatia bacterium]|nr:hypothetical protein [Candidatus Binatia bacterium]